MIAERAGGMIANCAGGTSSGRTARRIAGVVVAALALTGPARAEPSLEPRDLLARAFANLYADDYIQTMELAAESPGMRPVLRTLQILRKQSVVPGKALVRFLEPPLPVLDLII